MNGLNVDNISNYRAAVLGLSKEQAALLLSTKGLNQAQIDLILSNEQVTATQIAEAASLDGINAKKSILTAENQKQLLASKLLTTEKLAEIASTIGLETAENGSLISKKALNAEMVKQQLESLGVVGSAQAQIMSMLGLTTAETGAATASNVLSGAMAKLNIVLATNPIGALITAIGIAIGSVFLLKKGFDAVTDSAEDISERTEELITKYNEMKNTADNNAKTVESLADEYETLSKGVNGLGENVSLTSDEYDRYNEIVNQIAKMFPELVAGYTDEGNAILSLKGNVERLRDAYKEAQQEAYNLLVATGKDDNGNDIMEDYKNLSELDWWDAPINLESVTTTVKRDIAKQILDLMSNMDTAVEEYDKLAKDIFDKYGSAGYDYLEEMGLPAITDTFLDTTGITKEALVAGRATVQSYYQGFQSEIDNKLGNVRLLANAFLNINDFYKDDSVSSEIKNTLSLIVNSIDEETANSFNGDPQMVGAFVNSVVNGIKESDSKIKDAITDLFTNQELSPEQKNNLIKQIQDYFGKDNPISVFLQPQFEENETTQKNIESALSKFGEGSKGNLKAFFEKNSINTQEEVDKWNEITKGTNNATEAMEKYVQSSTSLNEKTSPIESIKTASESIKLLNSAMSDFNENGSISFSTIADIGDKFSDVSGIDKYIDKLLEADLSAQDLSSVLSDLTYAHLKSQVGIENLTEENESLIASMLEEQGVTNASEYASYAIARAKEDARVETILSKIAIDEHTASLLREQYAAGVTGAAFDELVLSIGIFNNQSLSIEDKIAKLKELGYYANWAANSFANIGNVKRVDVDGKKGVATYDKNGKLIGFEEDSAPQMPEIPEPVIPKYSGVSASDKSKGSKKDNAKDAAKQLADAQKQAADAQKQLNETIADLDKEQKLADFKHGIELINQELEKFGDELSMLDNKLDLTFEGDYISKMQTVGTQLKVASEYSVDLRTELNNLLNVVPANAAEAQALADQLENLGDKYYENQRAIIKYRDEMFSNRLDMLGELSDMSTLNSDRLSDMVDRTKSIMENGSITGDMWNMAPLPGITKSAVDRQRKENDELIEEERRYREQIAAIRKQATEMSKQEDDAEREKKRQEAYDKFNETMSNIDEKISDIADKAKESSSEAADTVISNANRASEGVKQAVDDMRAYAESNGVNVNINANTSKKENVNARAEGGTTTDTTLVNEVGREGYIGTDNKLHWFENGSQLFNAGSEPLRVLSAEDMQKIVKYTGNKYFNEPIGDINKVTAYKDGNTNVSFSQVKAVKDDKSSTSFDQVNDIVKEVQKAFDNMDISLDNVKKNVVSEFKDKSWGSEISKALESVSGDDIEGGLSSIILQQSSWDDLPSEIQEKLSDSLSVTSDNWNEWISSPDNALAAVQLCKDQGLSSWDMLSPTMLQIVNSAGIETKEMWDDFVNKNPLQALQLLISSWDALKAQIEQYMQDMVTIATNGAEAVHAITIEAPSISQQSWDNLQTVIANKIQEVINVINDTFGDATVDLNFAINTKGGEITGGDGGSTNAVNANANTDISQFGSGAFGHGRDALIAAARSQVGYTEGSNNANKFSEYGVKHGYAYSGAEAWCNDFVSWAAIMAGLEDSIPLGAGTQDTSSRFGSRLKSSSSYTPKVGDIAYYGDPIHHVEIVSEVHSNGTITTIGGNTGNGAVVERVRSDYPTYFGTYYTGSNGAKAGYATVGDGNAVKGDFKTPAPELIFKKSGGAYLAGINGTEVVKLDAGDTVVPHEETARMLKRQGSVKVPTNLNSYAKGTFKTYNLSDSAINTIATLVTGEAESGGKLSMYAEASQIVNLFERIKGGNDLSGWLERTDWYAEKSYSRGTNPIAVQAVKDVIINGYRTLPKYVTEHDDIGDILSVSPGTKSNRSTWVPHQTIIKQNPSRIQGATSYVYYDTPGGKGDPFGYFQTYKNKYPDDFHYTVSDSGFGEAGDSALVNKLIEQLDKILNTIQTNTNTGGVKLKNYRRLSGRQSSYSFDTPFTSLGKRANGGIIYDDETTIVNELGEEAVEHADGTIESLGTKPTLYRLRKGDKVYNAQDTAYLKKYLGNINRAKVKKLAKGSIGDMDIVTEMPELTKEQIGTLLTKFSGSISADDVYNAQQSSGVSALLILGIAAEESGWGKYAIGNNYWGYGATNDNPSGNAHKYGSGSAAQSFAQEFKKTFYDSYGLKTINQIGSGGGNGDRAYAQSSNGVASTTWAPSISSIANGFVNDLGGYSNLPSNGGGTGSGGSSSEKKEETKQDVIKDINKMLYGDDKLSEDSDKYSLEELKTIRDELKNLRPDEKITVDQLDALLNTSKKIEDIDNWLKTEFEDFLVKADKELFAKIQVETNKYNDWKKDFTVRTIDMLAHIDVTNPLKSYGDFLSEAYNVNIDNQIKQAQISSQYVKEATAKLTEQRKVAEDLFANALTASQQKEARERIEDIDSKISEHQKKYDEFQETIMQAHLNLIEVEDGLITNKISYIQKSRESLSTEYEKDTNIVTRGKTRQDLISNYNKEIEAQERRKNEANTRNNNDIYGDNVSEEYKFIREHFLLNEAVDANGDFNSIYTQYLALINSWVEEGIVGGEYVQVYKDMMNQLSANKKIYYEADNAIKEIDANIVSIKKEAIDDSISLYTQIQEKMIENLERRLSKQQSEIDAKTSLYDFQQSLFENKLEAQMEITANKELEDWLDPETRKLLFNDDDYSAYISGINRLNDEIQSEYEAYVAEINSLRPEEQYREEEITAAWERQLAIKQEELDVLKDEMNIAKKTLEYNNAAKERDTQIILGNRVVNVADPERLHTLAQEKTQLENQAALNRRTNSNNADIRNLESLKDVTQTQINAIQQLIEAINEMPKETRKAWVESLPTDEIMQAWLMVMNGTSVRWLNENISNYQDIIPTFDRTTLGDKFDAGTDYQSIINRLDEWVFKGYISQKQADMLKKSLIYAQSEKTATSKPYKKWDTGLHSPEYGSLDRDKKFPDLEVPAENILYKHPISRTIAETPIYTGESAVLSQELLDKISPNLEGIFTATLPDVIALLSKNYGSPAVEQKIYNLGDVIVTQPINNAEDILRGMVNQVNNMTEITNNMSNH